MRLLSATLAVLLACLAAPGPIGSALAQAAASSEARKGPRSATGSETVKRLLATGTINLGHRESSVPFSYYDNRKQVVGYSHDLMLKAVEIIRAELRLPSLTIKLVPVTPQNRMALVRNGTVDLECASTTHNAERERQVGFSNSIFVIGTRLMTHRDSGIADFADLTGRKVAVTAGTTSERLLRTFNERHGNRISIAAARDHGDAFALLEVGQAEAFMMDDALLYGERAKSRNPEQWIVVGTPMSFEAYGCMLRHGDAGFKALIDAALERLMRSGEAQATYSKWFQRPIPPRGLNLNWPPSEAVLELYRNPNDRPPR
jgi:glutamate/aspartate transport system substrate-binding protein